MSKKKEKVEGSDEQVEAEAPKKKFLVARVDVANLEESLNVAEDLGYDVFKVLENAGDREQVDVIYKAKE